MRRILALSVVVAGLCASGGAGAAFLGMVDEPCSLKEDGQPARDWPALCRYRGENRALTGKPRPDVVFMGDSITEGWKQADPAFFSDRVLDRGISGQTSPQMLLRFPQDVIALRPRVVHLMAGTNDIAGNTGPGTVEDYQHNITVMLDLAAVHGIQVVLAAIPPARLLPWAGIDPRPRITQLNAWLAQQAKARRLVFVDYAEGLTDGAGGIAAAYSEDGVHPNAAGYARMRPLTERALRRAGVAAPVSRYCATGSSTRLACLPP